MKVGGRSALGFKPRASQVLGPNLPLSYTMPQPPIHKHLKSPNRPKDTKFKRRKQKSYPTLSMYFLDEIFISQIFK